MNNHITRRTFIRSGVIALSVLTLGGHAEALGLGSQTYHLVDIDA